jgi:hypothetical protein
MCGDMMEGMTALSGGKAAGGGGGGGILEALSGLAGVASSVAGARHNGMIRDQAIEAQNLENQKAMDMEREMRAAEEQRQLAFEQQQLSDIMTAATMARPESIKTSGDDAASDAMNKIIMAAHDYNTPEIAGQVDNSDVTSKIGQIVNDRMKKTRGVLKAQAALTAQGKTMSDILQAISGTAGDVATTAGFRRGSGQVAQRETAIPAATVRPADSFTGDLALLVGKGASGAFGKSLGKRGAFSRDKDKEEA